MCTCSKQLCGIMRGGGGCGVMYPDSSVRGGGGGCGVMYPDSSVRGGGGRVWGHVPRY